MIVVELIIAILAAVGLYHINEQIKFNVYKRQHPEEIEKMIDYMEKHKD